MLHFQNEHDERREKMGIFFKGLPDLGVSWLVLNKFALQVTDSIQMERILAECQAEKLNSSHILNFLFVAAVLDDYAAVGNI